MSQAKILLIEDERKIARFLELELEYEGYEVYAAEDGVTGLDLGANDYITKPFAIEELLARIRACMRMANVLKKEVDTGRYTLSDLLIDEKQRSVMRGSMQIELTPREFDLLLYMVKNANQVLNREQILTKVWGYDYQGDSNVVDVYIRYLRKKLDASPHVPIIHTVPGIGYTIKG